MSKLQTDKYDKDDVIKNIESTINILDATYIEETG